MKVVIINGSPKNAKNSTTMQLAAIIKNKFDDHEYPELSVGATILSLEKNTSKLNAVFTEISEADAIIWSFPVYVFVVPSQLMRFIELIQLHGPKNMLKGKYATSISTSFNFFDQTAHTYMREVCEDMGLQYFEGFSASAMDLGKPELNQNILGFTREFYYLSENKLPIENKSTPVSRHGFVYQPKDIEKIQKTGNQSVLVLSDAKRDDTNLHMMTDVFVKTVGHPVRVMNLNDVDIKGGCLGCGKCFSTAVCAYKDDFLSFFNEYVRPADAIIYAAAIQNRYVSATWKKYFDRNFVNGHIPILNGNPMGFLFSGPLRQIHNLREIFTGQAEVGRNPFIGFQTDECADGELLTSQISAFSEKVNRMLADPWMRPLTFLGVGGHKIFRDLVYSMRTLMVEDHKYYTEEGLYDFPE